MLPHAVSGGRFRENYRRGRSPTSVQVSSQHCGQVVQSHSVASSALGVGHAAEAVHGRTSADVAVLAVDGVALPGEGELVKCAWGEHDRYL